MQQVWKQFSSHASEQTCLILLQAKTALPCRNTTLTCTINISWQDPTAVCVSSNGSGCRRNYRNCYWYRYSYRNNLKSTWARARPMARHGARPWARPTFGCYRNRTGVYELPDWLVHRQWNGIFWNDSYQHIHITLLKSLLTWGLFIERKRNKQNKSFFHISF